MVSTVIINGVYVVENEIEMQVKRGKKTKKVRNDIFVELNNVTQFEFEETKYDFSEIGEINNCSIRIIRIPVQPANNTFMKLTQRVIQEHHIETYELKYEFIINDKLLCVYPKNIKTIVFESNTNEFDNFDEIKCVIVNGEVITTFMINGQFVENIYNWPETFRFKPTDIIEIKSNSRDNKWIFGPYISVNAPIDVIIKLYSFIILSDLYTYPKHNFCNELCVISLVYDKKCICYNSLDTDLIILNMNEAMQSEDFKMLQSNGRFSTEHRTIYSHDSTEKLDNEFLFGIFIRMLIQYKH